MTAYLQRHLTLSFLLQPTAIEVPLHDAEIAVLISEYLQNSPHFHIHKKTDYTHLAARLEMLDIAIGPGLSVRVSKGKTATIPYFSVTSP